MLTFTELREAKATPCGRCGTTHVSPQNGGTCPALSKAENEKLRSKKEAYKDMTDAERNAFAKKIGDDQRARERSKKVSSMGAYKGRKVRTEETDEAPASYDEAEMAETQLEFIEYAAREVKEHITSGKRFPEWMQNKLTGIHEKMKSLHAALGEHGQDDEDDMNEAKLLEYGVMGKRAFKRQEHEFEAELERRAEAQRKANDAMSRVIWIDGKVWKKDGKPVEFNDKKHAQNVIRSMEKKYPEKDFTAGSLDYYKQEGDTLKHKLKAK